ncbi:transporter [Streptomyces sp. NBC_00878]|uniref:transporter n=1 Tax=Streptomyces sp. NBC_00878 TaxID=2975854 RepID=UPI00225955DA|nr:transporter [Streptomyces sp. NBC_00878]MCX4906487.1 transporter [Streptomyces sp. NBC_00878]
MSAGTGTATTASTASPASVTPVTSVVVRLKLSLLRNGLRQSAGRRAAYVASLVVVLLFAALQLIGLIALRGNAHAMNVTVLITAVVALGWAVMPLFFPGGDETLDPTRLVMLPLRPRPLVRALLVASLVGIGPLFTLCLLVGSVVAMAHEAAAYVTGVVAVALALLVCVALARAVATANIRLLTSRKGRDLAVLSGLVIAVGAQVVNFGAQKIGSSGLSTLDPTANVLRWVPPASAIGAVDSVSEGSYAVGVAQLALSGVALAALLSYWQRSLTRLMTSPDGSTLQTAEPARDKAGRSSGLGRLLPAGRTGTVMERSLRYVWRDPKTKAAWVTSLAIGLIVPLFNALQGTGSIYFACFAAGMLGIQMYNQFGQDTSAFWMVAMTISSTRDAYVELRARALALLVITLPYAALVCVLTTTLLGDWAALPEVLGLSFALLGAMLATGAWSSARFPYSIPQEGYKGVAPGQAGLAWISIFGGMIAAALLSAPVIALTIWLNVSSGGDDWMWLLLPIGTAYGAAITLAGLRLAAPRTARRLPEILAAVSKG